jgi:hypothetical protein
MNNLTDRINQSKPPKNAYLYFPKGNDVIEVVTKDYKKSKRKIFDIPELEYTYYEQEQLILFNHEFKKYSERFNFSLPDNWKVGDTLRFLQTLDFDFNKTCETLKDHIQWRSIHLPAKLNDRILEILNCGFCYMHGRDSHFRPISIFRPRVYLNLKNNYTNEEWLQATVYFTEYIINNMLIPGQIEGWLLIVEMKDVSLLQIPRDLINIFKILQTNYKCRLNKIYLLNMSSVVTFCAGLIKSWVGVNTFKKMQFVKDINEIFETINPEQVENKFNGRAENRDIDFFPPYMPSEKYLLNNQTEEDTLVSEDQYRELVNSNKVVTISPYYQYDTKSNYTVANTHFQPFITIRNYSKTY